VNRPTHFALVGLGRAGLARLKAIHELQDALGIHCQYTCSKRGAASQYDPTYQIENEPDFQKLITQKDIDTVVICSENQLHFEQCQMALSQGLNVVVDFPACYTLRQAHLLFELSHKHNALLRIAFIGDLSTQSKLWLDQVQHDPLQSICLQLEGGYYRWIKSDAQQGHLANLAMSRIKTLYQLAGPIQSYQLDYKIFENGYDFSIKGHTQTQTTFDLSETRRIDLPRKVKTYGIHKSGLPMQESHIRQVEPLFKMDFQALISQFESLQQGHFEQLKKDKEIYLDVIAFCEQIDIQIRKQKNL
jgi:hypothetical protein